MKISSVEIQGFRGVKERVNINFGLGFTVISGRNGAGKSTICDAIEYALTGQIRSNSISEKGENILDYIWWRGKGKPEDYFVRLVLSSTDGKEYTILRNREGLKTSIDLDNLLINSKSAPTGALNQLIKINIIRDEEITQTSIDLKEKDRFIFVRNSIGIENLDEFELKAKEVNAKLNELMKNLTSKYEERRKQITELTTNISEIKAETFTEEDVYKAEFSIKNHFQKKEYTKSDLIRLANEKLLNLVGSRNRLKEIISESNSLSNQLKSIVSEEFLLKIEEQQLKINKINKEINHFDSEIKKIEPVLKDLEDQNPKLTSFAQLSNHGKSLGLIDGRCPLCGSEIKEDQFAKHLFSIDEMIKTNLKSLSDLVSRKNKITENIRGKEVNLRKESFELEALTKRRETIDDRLKELKEEIDTLDINIDITNQEALAKKINELDIMVNELRNNINILQVSRSYEKVLDLEKKITLVKEDADSLLKRIQHLQEIQLSVKNDYDLIRRSTGEIIDERLAEISPLLTELYFRLRPHIDWDKIAYNVRGDVSRFLSLRTDDDLNPNFIFSSGQRRAVGLAFLMAVHLSIQWSNLETLILDDPIQHVDDYRALHFVETLSSIRMSDKQVICTVEDPELASLLCRRLRGKSQTIGKLVEMSFKSSVGVTIKSDEIVQPMKRDVLLAG